jgi:hypothetical protein
MPNRSAKLLIHPISSIVSRQLPLRSTATLAALPAMSLIPLAPFNGEKPLRTNEAGLRGLAALTIALIQRHGKTIEVRAAPFRFV